MPSDKQNGKVVPFVGKRWSVTQTPNSIAEKGEALYRERFQTEYEQKYPGKYVAIDVGSGKAFIANTPEAAIESLLAENPNGFYHVLRVGSPGVYRVGYAKHDHSRDWLFR